MTIDKKDKLKQEIVLLKGVLPLKEKIILSEKLGIELDNPRTEAEIKDVKEFLLRKVEISKSDNGKKYNPQFYQKIVSNLPDNLRTKNQQDKTYEVLYALKLKAEQDLVPLARKKFDKKFKGTPKWDKIRTDHFADKLVISELDIKKSLRSLISYQKKNRFFNSEFFNNDEDAESLLSKSWLIIRYDYTDCPKYNEAFFIPDDESDGEYKEERIRQTKKYFISVFDLLMSNKFSVDLCKSIIFSNVVAFFQKFKVFYDIIERSEEGNDPFDSTFSCYSTIANSLSFIKSMSDKIENFSDDQLNKLLFIGEIMDTINSVKSEIRVSIPLLVSIIELLLTRNPDGNRFNVEDSINKQFALKASLVINKMRPRLKMKELSMKFKLIYDIRSKIAHGDFQGLNKSLKNTKKDRLNIDDKKIWEILDELFKYTSLITLSYIKNPEFIDSLKEL